MGKVEKMFKCCPICGGAYKKVGTHVYNKHTNPKLGELNPSRRPEVRAKMREKARIRVSSGNWVSPMLSLESRLKISRALRGKSNSLKGKTYYEIYGDRAEEQKKRRRQSISRTAIANTEIRRERALRQWRKQKENPAFMESFIKKVGVVGWSGRASSEDKDKRKRKISEKNKLFWGNPELKAKVLEQRSNPLTKQRMSESQRKRLREHPETTANWILAHNKVGKAGVSKPQIKLFEAVRMLYSGAELNYPIVASKVTYFIDVAVPSKLIGFEYDEPYWHGNKEKDRARDAEISALGWRITHVIKEEDIAEAIKERKDV